MQSDDLYNSDQEEVNDDVLIQNLNDSSYFDKSKGLRLASFFKNFESSSIDNQFEDGNQMIKVNDEGGKSWDYNPNNLFNHTIDDLNKILDELKTPLLDMVEGKIELDQEVFNKNTIQIKFINWFLSNKFLHKNLNKEVYVENILRNQIIDYRKKTDLIVNKIVDIQYKIKLLESELCSLEKEKENEMLNNCISRNKLTLHEKFTGIDSNPLSIINKSVFLTFIESSIDEINEFKLNSPVEIHDLLNELIDASQARLESNKSSSN